MQNIYKSASVASKFMFRGSVAPVFTPFKNDSTKSLNLDIIPKYAKYLNDNGIKGVLVNGTTGEGMSQSVQERKLVAEKWMEAKKLTNQHIMVQVGGAPFPDVLEMAKHADTIGVDSLMCLPELYFKPTTVAELTRYLRKVGEAAPKTPLLYYHIPANTNVNIHMGQFLREVDGKIPTFVGIKFTSPDLPEGLEAVYAHNKKFAVFLGVAPLLLEAYKQGFDSAIATVCNVFPHMTIQIHESVFKGKLEEGIKFQNNLNQAIACISKHGAWVPTMKEAMRFISPFDMGPPRDPIACLTAAQIKDMEEDIKKLQI